MSTPICNKPTRIRVTLQMWYLPHEPLRTMVTPNHTKHAVPTPIYRMWLDRTYRLLGFFLKDQAKDQRQIEQEFHRFTCSIRCGCSNMDSSFTNSAIARAAPSIVTAQHDQQTDQSVCKKICFLGSFCSNIRAAALQWLPNCGLCHNTADFACADGSRLDNINFKLWRRTHTSISSGNGSIPWRQLA